MGHIFTHLYTIYKFTLDNNCFQTKIFAGVNIFAVVFFNILKGICPLFPVLEVVLFGILKGMYPLGPTDVFVNLKGTCSVVPLGVMRLGVKPVNEKRQF